MEEPPEPKTGTAQTVPPPNRNRTEPNRGHPEIALSNFYCHAVSLEKQHFGRFSSSPQNTHFIFFVVLPSLKLSAAFVGNCRCGGLASKTTGESSHAEVSLKPFFVTPLFTASFKNLLFGHLLRGRSLKGRCNICVYVRVRVPVCVCPSSPHPPDPTHTVGLNSRNPSTPPHDPSPPFPHPCPQAIA